jgi:hypothetical protein
MTTIARVLHYHSENFFTGGLPGLMLESDIRKVRITITEIFYCITVANICVTSVSLQHISIANREPFYKLYKKGLKQKRQ